MSRSLRTARLAGAVAALAGVVWFSAGPASAAAPAKDGWWDETNSGTGIPAPEPPQVPKNGLYVENGYSGPVAIAALSFAVPSGQTAQTVLLHVAGSAVITQPPIACPIAATSLNYQPAQDGSWSKRPSYQCSTAKVAGQVGSGMKTVSFQAGSLERGGTLAIVVLAGGPADAIAFEPPGGDAIQFGSGSASFAPTPVGAPAPFPATSPAPSSGAPAAPAAPAGTGGSGLGGAAPQPAPSLSGGANPTTAPAAAAGPVFAGAGGPSGAAGGTPPPGRVAGAALVRGGHGTPWRRDVAGGLALAAVAVALVAWSEGFGLLGGRIRLLGRYPSPRAVLNKEA